MYSRIIFFISLFIAYVPLGVRAEPTGRSENIDVRAFKPKHAETFSGPYQKGEVITEIKSSDSVQIAGNDIPISKYETLHKAGFIPMLREMDNRAFIESLKQMGLNEEQLIHKIKDRLSCTQTILPEIWGFKDNDQKKRAEDSYAQWFSPDGKLLKKDFFEIQPPYLDLLRWAYYYKQTNDPKWAAAVRNVYLEFYRKVRPPAQKVQNPSINVRTMWHPLTAGSGTPMLVEAYTLISNWSGLSTQDHLDFLKSFLERGRYLRYTTVPYGPWPKYNPFGYGNWILYQLQGLLAISTAFPEFKESENWEIHSSEGIGVQADWLILPDSGITEYSLDYANQIAAQFEWCYMTFARFSLPFPRGFKNNILRLHELFLALVNPDDIKISFGDTARGKSNAISRCAWAALAFLDGRFKYWAPAPPLSRLNSLAAILRPHDPDSLLEEFHRLQPVAPPMTSDILPEVGWVIMRSGQSTKSTILALSYKASEKVYHSGYEALGFSLWSNGEELMTKLLGQSGYERGYPEGFHRTSKVANTILIENACFTRESGSLRNWHSSEQLDYLEADHLGWDNGAVRISRRVLFLKPDWILFIDDIDTKKQISATWQAHTGTILPELFEKTVRIQGSKAEVEVAFLDATPKIKAYQIPEKGNEGFLLTTTKTSSAPMRFVTLMRIASTPSDKKIDFEQITRPGAKGVKIFANKKSTEIWWEDEISIANRFIGVITDNTLSFLASDPDASHVVQDLLTESHRSDQWNGRVIAIENDSIPAIVQKDEAIPPENISVNSWSGIDVLTTVRNHARVTWTVREPARHSILYRVAGTSLWQRQLQPDLFRRAWILLPDLLPETGYQIKAVSEFPDGRIHTSPIIEWYSKN